MKTMQETAQQALLAQNACNLSGLVFSFAEIMKIICEEDQKNHHSTDWKNTHPICVLMIDKMYDLAKCSGNYPKAYDSVTRLANGD